MDSVPLKDFRNAIGGSSDDLITGNIKGNILDGRAGNDTIDGDDSGGIEAPLPDGDDSIFGGDGNDSIIGDGGQDTIDGQAGNDTINGGPGHDALTGGAGTDLILGDSGNDRFFAFDGSIDTLYGGSGTDTATVDSLLDTVPNNDIEFLIPGP